jgi:cytoskeletal protein RodZ
MENQNKPQDPSEIELEPKRTYLPHHKYLWFVIAALLLIVVVGTYFWWQEIKTNQSSISIEKFISEKYQDAKIQKAALQYAKAIELEIKESDNQEASKANVKKGVLGVNCIFRVVNSDSTLSTKIIADVRSFYLNNEVNIKAYYKAQESVTASDFPNIQQEQLNPCE